MIESSGGMPYCEVCHYRLDQRGNCPHCEERMEEEAERAAVDAAEEHRRFEAYQGDTYLTDSWMEDGLTAPEAIAKVQNTQGLCWMLEFGGLEKILADRWATQALRRELMAGNKAILECLLAGAKALKKSRAKRKRGPRPKTGKYVYEKVYALREQGLSFGQIARRLWKDPKKDRLAAAHYHQAKVRLQLAAPRPQ